MPFFQWFRRKHRDKRQPSGNRVSPKKPPAPTVAVLPAVDMRNLEDFFRNDFAFVGLMDATDFRFVVKCRSCGYLQVPGQLSFLCSNCHQLVEVQYETGSVPCSSCSGRGQYVTGGGHYQATVPIPGFSGGEYPVYITPCSDCHGSGKVTPTQILLTMSETIGCGYCPLPGVDVPTHCLCKGLGRLGRLESKSVASGAASEPKATYLTKQQQADEARKKAQCEREEEVIRSSLKKS